MIVSPFFTLSSLITFNQISCLSKKVILPIFLPHTHLAGSGLHSGARARPMLAVLAYSSGRACARLSTRLRSFSMMRMAVSSLFVPGWLVCPVLCSLHRCMRLQLANRSGLPGTMRFVCLWTLPHHSSLAVTAMWSTHRTIASHDRQNLICLCLPSSSSVSGTMSPIHGHSWGLEVTSPGLALGHTRTTLPLASTGSWSALAYF